MPAFGSKRHRYDRPPSTLNTRRPLRKLSGEFVGHTFQSRTVPHIVNVMGVDMRRNLEHEREGGDMKFNSATIGFLAR